jgi:hypothetical protein
MAASSRIQYDETKKKKKKHLFKALNTFDWLVRALCKNSRSVRRQKTQGSICRFLPNVAFFTPPQNHHFQADAPATNQICPLASIRAI